MMPLPRFAASCFKLSAAEAGSAVEPVTNVTLTVLAALVDGGVGGAAATVAGAAGG
jgi:hypothetical protein